jgi:NIMA (never in mitosis gene a)-related kinase
METCLSDYVIQGEIGRGSFGVVYKAINRRDQRIYVVKRIHMGAMSIKNQKEALFEVQILKTIDHPNIIKYYGSFLEDQTLHIIMEYAEGGDLQKHLRQQREKKKKFTEKEIWKYAGELASAISYLHSRNIIHRDIKCLNILLTKDQQLKLADLGASKITDAQMLATRVGTPLYLAPELVRQVPYDFKVDIWALGCVLYQLACMEAPFLGDNLISLGYSIVNRRPKQLPPNYSARLNEFIMILLSKKPQERPGIKEVIDMLPNQINESAPAPVPFDLQDLTTDFTLAKTLKEEPIINHSPAFLPNRPQSPIQTTQSPKPPKIEASFSVVRFVPIPERPPSTGRMSKKASRNRLEDNEVEVESVACIKEKFFKPAQQILDISGKRPTTQPGSSRKVAVTALSRLNVGFSPRHPRIIINPSPREINLLSPKTVQTSRNSMRSSGPVRVVSASSDNRPSKPLAKISSAKIMVQDDQQDSPIHLHPPDLKRPQTASAKQTITIHRSITQDIAPPLSNLKSTRPQSAVSSNNHPLFKHKFLKNLIRPPETITFTSFKREERSDRKKLSVSDLKCM